MPALLDMRIAEETVRRALQEDLGTGDVTTLLTVPEGVEVTGEFLAGQSGVLAGMPVAERVFHLLDPRVRVEPLVKEGQYFVSGTVLAEVRGEARALLMGERVALNFLQRLSGIATLTARFVEMVRGLPVRICDTRKTTPGLRYLERYAVRVGGGYNHRFGLYDAVLIKDNHLAVCGSVAEAVQRVRRALPHTMRIEVECTTLQQVQEALDAGADILLLDNMSLDVLQEAVRLAKGRAFLEASGGVCLENVRQIAETGVEAISIGALTHSAPAIDIKLEFR
ncbi:MAG: carboxylating nicotinate-nucleotide diphosphorylase [Armatimonadota bacterium]|nr:carboxylating nicotinate-nucleotide diphosphorylase [bacterium]MCS7309003.1 carboxylating nicotinate-nucleotide diphosphorylase [Armatimonadota bacterium]MDW8103442.1 carboxylating nicotinate-nucleotide diphosphorylase [Armatimonadota bacterium]MDW8289578.1 carboxylating nicotinate-nucleotide diphosphorylase [Armatimonadota bacterium]